TSEYSKILPLLNIECARNSNNGSFSCILNISICLLSGNLGINSSNLFLILYPLFFIYPYFDLVIASIDKSGNNEKGKKAFSIISGSPFKCLMRFTFYTLSLLFIFNLFLIFSVVFIDLYFLYF